MARRAVYVNIRRCLSPLFTEQAPQPRHRPEYLEQKILLYRVLSLTLLATGVLSASGCSSKAEDGANFTDFSGVQSEYAAIVKDFPYALPEGITFPAKVQDVSKEPTVYGRGEGTTRAYSFWECAWQDQALQSYDKDKSEFSKALDMMDVGLTSVYHTKYVEDPDGAWKGTIAKARLGDTAVFSEVYSSNCTWYREETHQ